MESTVISNLQPMQAAVCHAFVSADSGTGRWQKAVVGLHAAASKINSRGFVPTGADHRGRTTGGTPPRSGPPRSQV